MGIDKKKISSVLVRAPGWIGDSVISMPVVRTIRENFPKAFITVSVKDRVKELWDGFIYADEVVSDSEQKLNGRRGYDLGVIFPNSFSSAYRMLRAGVKNRAGYSTEMRGLLITHRVPKRGKFRSIHLIEEYFDILRHLGLKIHSKALFFKVPAKASNKIDRLISEQGCNDGRPIIGICPGASFGKAKAWPPERYSEVVKFLTAKYGARIALFAGKGETACAKIILQGLKKSDILSAGGELTITESAALIERCSLFISNDTGPMHIAAALNVPVIGIFGSTNPVWTGPLGSKSRVLYKKTECSPCFQRVCPRKRNKYECLLNINAEDVIGELKKFKTL